MKVECWQMESVGAPMVRAVRSVEARELPPDSVLIRVAGCGVCHTDLGFLYDGVPTRHALPLTLGHEISGVVTHAGPGAEAWIDRAVVVPAVMPCGRCELCEKRRGAICKKQIFPGNDDHGGFGTHVQVPAAGLCPVDVSKLGAQGLELADLAVIADAVTTPYQAILNSGLKKGHFAVFVGIGGVGLFGVQIARALGARVAAVDVDPVRIERAEACGAEWTHRIASDDMSSVKRELKTWAKANGVPRVGWRIFETSGHPGGQEFAFSLLNPGAHLGVVGYTPKKVMVSLSNLMAFDATARGTWGCLPEHYPAVVDLVARGDVQIRPYTEHQPMKEINKVFSALHQGQMTKRPILLPDFEGNG